MRRIAAGRRGWPFVGSHDHGEAAGHLFSLEASARLHRLDPERGAQVRHPLRLRVNAYHVLPTRARDLCVLYVPPLRALEETHAHLRACGARDLVPV